jgi:diguanylate cyclase (GGDEF)-like protein
LIHYLREETDKGQRYGTPFSLLLLDIDLLSNINQAYGHSRGDQVLLEIAHRLKILVRDTDFLFRLGGDEFVILLPNTRKLRAGILASRLVNKIFSTPVPGTPPLSIALSVGIASFPEDGITPALIFNVAGLRHDLAKRQGGRGFVSDGPPVSQDGIIAPPIKLIEREQALEALDTYFDSLPLQGRGALRVTGASGTGRSRFLVEVQNKADLLGYAVLAIRGSPLFQNRLYGALQEATSGMRNLPLPMKGIKVFAEAVANWIIAKGKLGLLVTIDDLQHVDIATRKFLEQLFFAGEIPLFGLVFVKDETGDIRQFPQNIPLQEPIELQPLSPAGLQAWLRQTIRWDAPEEFIGWLQQQTQGLPYAIQQGLEYLLAEDFLKLSQNAWICARDPAQIPLSIHIASLAVAPPHNLDRCWVSSTSNFFGREQEISQLKKALLEHSLVMLVGSSGVGKSRLALQVSRESMDQFPDGVFFVRCSGIRTLNWLIAEMIDTIRPPYSGFPSQSSFLTDYLRGKRMLLILDDYEQFVDGSQWLVDFLERAPETHIFVTSKERLVIPGAFLLELQGLPYPDDDEDNLLDELPSIQLFQHNVLIHPVGSHPGASEIESVAQICRLLEGMPLAIEMAAAWVQVIPPAAMTAKLQKDITLLRGAQADLLGQNRGFNALLEFLWKKLSASEQTVLSKLSVFEGFFSAEAAKAVADASPFFLEALADKLLVRRANSDRYEFHELVRLFASQHMRVESRPWVLARDRHSEYYLHLLHDFEKIKKGNVGLIAQVRANLQNVRAAWSWAFSRGRLEIAHPALQGMAKFYHQAGLNSEAENAFGIAIEQVQALGSEPANLQPEQQLTLGELLALQSGILNQRGKYQQAIEAAQSAVELCNQTGSFVLEASAHMEWAKALDRLSMPAEALKHAREAMVLAQSAAHFENQVEALRLQGAILIPVNPSEALATFQKALNLACDRSDRQQEAAIRLRVGLLHMLNRNLQTAREEYEKALSVFSDVKDPVGYISALTNLGKLSFSTGDHSSARSYFEQALQTSQEAGNPWSVSSNLLNLGQSCQRLGDYESSRAYFEQAMAISREIGEWGNEAVSLSSLGCIALQTGDARSAEKYQRESLALISGRENFLIQSAALNRLGNALAQMERFEEAEAAYQQAFQLRHTGGRLDLLLDPLAGLADIALKQNHLAEALIGVEKIIAQVGADIPEDHSDDPFWIYWVCYQVLLANADERAQEWMASGQTTLLAQADLIRNRVSRQVFLEAVPSHRALWQSDSAIQR